MNSELQMKNNLLVNRPHESESHSSAWAFWSRGPHSTRIVMWWPVVCDRTSGAKHWNPRDCLELPYPSQDEQEPRWRSKKRWTHRKDNFHRATYNLIYCHIRHRSATSIGLNNLVSQSCGPLALIRRQTRSQVTIPAQRGQSAQCRDYR